MNSNKNRTGAFWTKKKLLLKLIREILNYQDRNDANYSEGRTNWEGLLSQAPTHILKLQKPGKAKAVELQGRP